MGRDVKKIGIIGAGVGGLIAAKTFLEEGFDCEVLERKASLGGVWENGYHSLRLQLPKSSYEFLDWPMPASYPQYPTCDQIVSYLNSYARHFRVFKKIRFNCHVEKLDRQSVGASDPATPCAEQTRLDIHFRPMPLIVAMIAGEGCGGVLRYVDTQAAYDGMPDKLREQVESVRIRWRPRPDLRLDAVSGTGHELARAVGGAHVLTGAQFFNMMLSGDCEIIGYKEQHADQLLADIRGHAFSDLFCCKRERIDGELIAWDPRRVFYVPPDDAIEDPRFVYPTQLEEPVMCHRPG